MIMTFTKLRNYDLADFQAVVQWRNQHGKQVQKAINFVITCRKNTDNEKALSMSL